MNSEQLLRKILQDHGRKTTRPRLLVFAALHGSSPLTMKELTDSLAGKIDRVSVYRIVELFEQLGVVKRIPMGWKYRLELGDIFSSHHHHITCLHCGRVVAVKENEDAEHLINKLGRDNGFYVTSHQLELQGYCETCQALRQQPGNKD